jgi:RNA-directed DNA polymerase
MEGKDEMTKASGGLQDLRRGIYVKAKTEPSWRFWGLYVHVCKRETLREAYEMAKKNDGAPGIDGVTFAAIEAQGVDDFSRMHSARTDHAHLCAAAVAKEGDTEGRGEDSAFYRSRPWLHKAPLAVAFGDCGTSPHRDGVADADAQSWSL